MGPAWMIIRPLVKPRLTITRGHFLLVLVGYLVWRNGVTGHVRQAGAHVFRIRRSPLVGDREHSRRSRRIDFIGAQATEDADWSATCRQPGASCLSPSCRS